MYGENDSLFKDEDKGKPLTLFLVTISIVVFISLFGLLYLDSISGYYTYGGHTYYRDYGSWYVEHEDDTGAYEWVLSLPPDELVRHSSDYFVAGGWNPMVSNGRFER